MAVGTLTIRQTFIGETSVIRKIIRRIDMVSVNSVIIINPWNDY